MHEGCEIYVGKGGKHSIGHVDGNLIALRDRIARKNAAAPDENPSSLDVDKTAPPTYSWRCGPGGRFERLQLEFKCDQCIHIRMPSGLRSRAHTQQLGIGEWVCIWSAT